MISIIVPVYNGEKTIEKCIHSLQDQSYPTVQYEIIVVDDGSTDNTPTILKKSGVQIVTQKNQGPATARNAGAKVAKGEILIFTDADCIADNRWLEEMVAAFNDKDVVGVKGAYKTLQKELTARFAQAEFEERYKLLQQYDYIDFVDTYSAGFRKDIFFKIGAFDQSFPLPDHEDVDLSYRLSREGYKMAFTSKAFVYHQHPNTLKKYLRVKFGRAFWRIAVCRRYPEKIIKDTYTPQSLKLQIILVYLLIVFLAGSAVSHFFLYSALVTFCIFLSTTISFVLHVGRNDILLSFLIPLFIFLRASSLGMGVLYGIFFGRNQLAPTASPST